MRPVIIIILFGTVYFAILYVIYMLFFDTNNRFAIEYNASKAAEEKNIEFLPVFEINTQNFPDFSGDFDPYQPNFETNINNSNKTLNNTLYEELSQNKSISKKNVGYGGTQFRYDIPDESIKFQDTNPNKSIKDQNENMLIDDTNFTSGNNQSSYARLIFEQTTEENNPNFFDKIITKRQTNSSLETIEPDYDDNLNLTVTNNDDINLSNDFDRQVNLKIRCEDNIYSKYRVHQLRLHFTHPNSTNQLEFYSYKPRSGFNQNLIKKAVKTTKQELLRDGISYKRYKDLVPVGQNLDLKERERYLKFYKMWNSFIPYNVIVYNLNTIIYQNFSANFILENYAKACLIEPTCYGVLKYFDNKIKKLFERIDFYYFKEIIEEYIQYNRYDKTDIKRFNFIETMEKTFIPRPREYEGWILMGNHWHMEYFNDLIKTKCDEFEIDYKNYLSLFDPEKEILAHYIRALVIKSRTIYSIEPFHEIFNYYNHYRFPAIFYFLFPVKKCVLGYCIVLVPFRVTCSPKGCFGVQYTLYNGVKLDMLPSIHFLGDLDKAIARYQRNIKKAFKSDPLETKLFKKNYATGSFFNHFINIPNNKRNNTLKIINQIITNANGSLSFEEEDLDEEYHYYKDCDDLYEDIMLNLEDDSKDKYDNYFYIN